MGCKVDATTCNLLGEDALIQGPNAILLPLAFVTEGGLRVGQLMLKCSKIPQLKHTSGNLSYLNATQLMEPSILLE